MQAAAELELSIEKGSGGSYQLQLRFQQPESEAEVRLGHRSLHPVSIPWEELQALTFYPERYGRRLTDALFEEAEVRAAFAQARSVAEASRLPLRLRLHIGPSAAELQNLVWECLHDPLAPERWLLTDEQVFFSRYLSSYDWRPVRLRPRSQLRCLTALVNPTDVDEYHPGGTRLAPIQTAVERERIETAIGDLPNTVLERAVTLDALTGALREGVDLFFLVCHGAMIKGEPRLWLQQEDGSADVISGRALVERIRDLEHRPRLIVLISCQSAGAGEGLSAYSEVTHSLGPLLAEAGVPAVIAMHGNLSHSTGGAFLSNLLAELSSSGCIDEAMALARSVIRDARDAWMPVLYMRLKSGRIWYVPGFSDERNGLKKWPALIRNIQMGRCTPILGPGLLDALCGPREQIAQKWAEQYRFPMAPQHREELPLVAQFLAVEQDRFFVQDELRRAMSEALVRRHALRLPPHLRTPDGDPPLLEEQLRHVGQERRTQNPNDPHRILANLPFPLYIMVGWDDLLVEALREAGKQPEIEVCRWNGRAELIPSIYDRQPDFRPTPSRPLVYYLLGRYEEHDSIVLTQDDYFDFLMGYTTHHRLIPGVVLRALTDSALLMLGFQLDEWVFRVLYRIVQNQDTGNRRGQYAHVAAQIDPEEGRVIEPREARRHLESYFQTADISIFWGSLESFMEELARRLQGGRR